MKKLKLTVMLAFMFICIGMISTNVNAETYQMITPGTSFETAAQIPEEGVDYVFTQEEQPEDGTTKDFYFKFTVPSQGSRLYTVYTKDLSMSDSFRTYFYNSIQESMDDGSYYQHVNDEWKHHEKLQPGETYYIKIQGYYGTGNIKLNVSSLEDKEADTMGEASNISIGKKIVASSDGDLDNDYFRFVPTVTGNYKLYAKNNSMSDSFKFKLISSSEEELYSSYYVHKNNEAVTGVKLQAGCTYYIKIEGYYGTGTYQFYVKQINPSKVGKLTLKTIPYTGISSKWSKVKDATAYEIQLSTSKNFSTYNSYTTSTTKYDSKYLLAKKKYYVRVRAYVEINGEKYYGAYSSVKSIKTKK